MPNNPEKHIIRPHNWYEGKKPDYEVRYRDLLIFLGFMLFLAIISQFVPMHGNS